MPKVYLAGPDVFRCDALEHGAHLKRLCAAHGLEGLYPLDNALPAGLAPAAAAQWIFAANVALLRSADAVLANLEPFRGHEPDSGTVFEVGMAVALGKPLWVCFAPAGDLRAQVPHGPDGRDAQGWQVEDFGLPRNLMLACSWAGHSATVEAAIAALARHLGV
ncbi:nucleoside 2-deoxyribosyltransferase [Azotobacter beijerinckii]|uniref:nucleoside 2-deoxyribosyltransferase n=1 Tax=Azotobacter beijerinckii TaxID=170623 RepID=UPI0029552083|nr:nucleoside 2-deoxyribosyltransferase [Azotobacter beijerinckii]MDV7211268.1 nucleoside 2-deoxyribosyltransferase [Azotobacter beijerinckii]